MKELQFREKHQTCPYCLQKHPVRLAGVIKSIHDKNEITQEHGFSFCNCKNIFFTDRNNLDKAVYNDEYVKKYDGSYEMFKKLWDDISPRLTEGNNGKLVEIGPMNKAICDGASDKGYHHIAVDINKYVHDEFDDAVQVDLDDSMGMYYQFPEDVSVIWCTHVLEHVLDPIGTMRKFHDALIYGGLVFIAMPDPFFIDWNKPYDWGHWWVREHHTLWDRDTFIEECEKIGFKCVYKKRNGAGAYVCNNDFHVILRKD